MPPSLPASLPPCLRQPPCEGAFTPSKFFIQPIFLAGRFPPTCVRDDREGVVIARKPGDRNCCCCCDVKRYFASLQSVHTTCEAAAGDESCSVNSSFNVSAPRGISRANFVCHNAITRERENLGRHSRFVAQPLLRVLKPVIPFMIFNCSLSWFQQ